jgi:TonB family protein
MQSTHWKLGLLVSVLHVAVFIAISHLGLRPLDHGAQSAISSQVIELRSADPQKRVTSRSIAEPSPLKAMGVAQPSSVRGDAVSIVAQGNASELMTAPITPPSADVYALRNPKPPYPISSRENGEQGAVMLYACITDHGKVERLDLAQSSGHPALDRSALNTVRHWSFRPAQESGKSIPMCYRLPIRFLLSSTALLAAFA